MTMSEMIRQICKDKKMSLSELARRLGQSPQNFSQKLRRGTLTIDELDRITEITGVTLGRTDDTEIVRGNQKKESCIKV